MRRLQGRYPGSQVPGSPEGEKQGAGQSSPGRRRREQFLAGIQGCGPGRKNREEEGRMTLTRLFLPFGRLQKEGPRWPEANKNEH